MIIGIFFLFITIIHDLKKEHKSFILTTVLIFGTLLLYSYQRFQFHHFDLFIADASDYYLAGINEVINGGDLGFFLPLTASISAVGFTLFGYKYAAVMMILLYSAVIPLLYLVLRELRISAWISLGMTVLFISLPLDIWFSKSMFSEPIWQLELLILLLLSVKILQHTTISKTLLLALYLLMLVTPFTRGEASLFYGVIFFLALYHYWTYQQLKSALLIIISILILALSIHYTIGLRTTYLLEWQYARLIPHITPLQLMSLLYGMVAFMVSILLILSRFKTAFASFRLPLWTTLFLLFLKVCIAAIYSIKKAALAHTLLFKNALGFSHFFILNELSFTLDNFGLPLTILVVLGLGLLYFQALRGDKNALLIVGFYTLFTLPFVMQSVHAQDIHEIFLYWGRYYFSALMLVHLLALATLLYTVSKLLEKYFPQIHYKQLSLGLLGFIFILFVSSSKLYTIVTTESYLSNSHKLIPWIKEQIHNTPLSIVYDETIQYELHHNRHYNVKELTYRSFPMAGIKVAHYQQAHPNTLNTKLKLEPKMKKSKYLLCLAQKPCELDTTQFELLGNITLPISWRENYGIHAIDKEIHQNKLEHSIIHTLNLYATLYTIQEKFNYAEEILFSHDSVLSSKILSKGWYMPTDKQGAWSKENYTQLTLPYIEKNNKNHYRISLEYFIFNASKQHPKTMTISLNGKVLKKVIAHKSMMKTLTFGLPNTLLSDKQKEVTLDIVMRDATQQQESKRKGMYLKSITLYN